MRKKSISWTFTNLWKLVVSSLYCPFKLIQWSLMNNDCKCTVSSCGLSISERAFSNLSWQLLYDEMTKPIVRDREVKEVERIAQEKIDLVK